jgi:hypothetical protein
MDAVGIAEAFGIRGVQITHPDQLIPAITDALASNEPVSELVHRCTGEVGTRRGTASARKAAGTKAGGTLVSIQMQGILFFGSLLGQPFRGRLF